jgi:hypothetical protein
VTGVLVADAAGDVAFAELERDIIHERTTAGLAAAKAQGRIGGRPDRDGRGQAAGCQGTARAECGLRALGWPGPSAAAVRTDVPQSMLSFTRE